MITQEITVNGKKFNLRLTDQSIMDARRLKALYHAAYEDPESFEEVSSAISNTINQLATAVEPEVSGDDLDGVIQAIMKVVEEKAKEAMDAKNKPAESQKMPKSTGKSTKKPKK
ncbi:MAG TPA: hypothetical protein VLB45_02945 [Nitrosopumilaceae archaeon]|nr:hypothetical protein [Nitrosopumilaceae archaeon]